MTLSASCTHTMRAAPLALGSLVQFWLKAYKVVRSGTGVTQDDLAALLTHLTVVLVIGLIAVTFLLTWNWKQKNKPYY